MCPIYLGKSKENHLSTLLFIYIRLFTLLQKKNYSNCCTATLAVYLLLFNASLIYFFTEAETKLISVISKTYQRPLKG